MFKSEIECVGDLAFPEYSVTRVMMMPFHLHDPRGSLPETLAHWREAVAKLCELAPVKRGVAYLTIDEADVGAGDTHRRPGLHVDWATNADADRYGGSMVAATVEGCRGWAQDFDGEIGVGGDCSHMASQCRADREVVLRAGGIFKLGALAVHESIAQRVDGRRQFVRVSMNPMQAAWFDGYTRNPLGIDPTGPVLARRQGMDYRPSVSA